MSCKDCGKLLDMLAKNADTFEQTAQALRVLRHNIAAEAMDIAKAATRAAIAEWPKPRSVEPGR